MKQVQLGVLVGLAAVLCVASANAVETKWESKTCLTIDNTFHVCKPDTKWDTQSTGEDTAPVKWVYHKTGANPVIWLQYDGMATGKTAHDYAKQVTSRLKARGIKVDQVKNEVISGRNVSLLYGTDTNSGFRYLVGVWRNRAKGFNLQCSAAGTDFGAYEPHCMTSIQSVRIVNEQ